jgi:acetolactate synthase-1/2/3 large subunit
MFESSVERTLFSSHAERTGAEIVCDVLLENHVSTLFGYTGGAILPFYDALCRYPALHHVMVRHEQAAAHAAAGYARVTGRAGVCVTTSGPGATNLLTGIMDARLDSTPMVILGGQVSTKLIGSDAFQETDMMCMTATVTKHNFQPRSVEELEEVLRASFVIAQTGRPGPVYVDLPKDVLEAKTSYRGHKHVTLPGYKAVPRLEKSKIKEVLSVLGSAKRPLFLVGGGAVHADAGETVLALAEQWGIPMVTTIMAKGLVSEDHPLVLGPMGMYGRKSAQYALMHCDVLLALGCRFSDRITGNTKVFAEGKTIVHVDIDAYELGKNVPAHVAVQADVKDALQVLLLHAKDTACSEEVAEWRASLGVARQLCVACVPHQAQHGVHPKHVMDVLNACKSPEDVVTTGVGQHQMFATHFLQHQVKRTFVTSGGAGTMGFGLPSAIGCAKAKPDQWVFVVDGDGSFQMTSQELATVAQEGLKIIVLVLDNGQLGMVRQWQDRVYDGRHQAVWFTASEGHPDLAALAQAYGVLGYNVDSAEALREAIADAQQQNRAALIRILVQPNIDMLPMMPSGAKLTDFYGNCVPKPGVLYSEQDVVLIGKAGKKGCGHEAV